MKIKLTERLQRDVRKLQSDEQAQLFSVILKIPQLLKEPRQHAGLGLRKIHRSGIYEARIGLGLRLVFGFASDTAVLHRVGNHDDIRRYIKSL